MKVRVSMPGSYMVMEMNEEQAHKIFHKIVELLCVSGSRKVNGEEAAKIEPNYKPSPVFVPEEEEKKIPENTKSEFEIEPAIPNISIGYTGFLHIKCPDCGKIKGFCTKIRLSKFRCECGSVTRLENLAPLYMNCECGKNSRYMTNMEDLIFDITCYDCGNPVPVSWNSKKKQYETIRG